MLSSIINVQYYIGYAEHVLNTRQSYGTMQYTMEVMKVTNKGPITDTIETQTILYTKKIKGATSKRHVKIIEIQYLKFYVNIKQ